MLTCDTLYPQKFALTSSTSGDRWVGIVRLWTQATEFSFRFSLLCFFPPAVIVYAVVAGTKLNKLNYVKL
jgi:hypothetical protein